MKNSPKNNYSGKKSNQYQKKSGKKPYPKNKNYSKNNSNLFINSPNNKDEYYQKGGDKKKNNFSSLNRRKPLRNTYSEAVNKPLEIHGEISNKKILRQAA